MNCWFLSWNYFNANCLYHCRFPSFESLMNAIASFGATKTLPNIKRHLHQSFTIYICVSLFNSHAKITDFGFFRARSQWNRSGKKNVYPQLIEHCVLYVEDWAVLKWSQQNLFMIFKREFHGPVSCDVAHFQQLIASHKKPKMSSKHQ